MRKRQLYFSNQNITKGKGSYEIYRESILNHGVIPSRIISINNQKTGFALTVQGLGVQLVAGVQLIENISELDYLTVSGMPLSRHKLTEHNEYDSGQHPCEQRTEEW